MDTGSERYICVKSTGRFVLRPEPGMSRIMRIKLFGGLEITGPGAAEVKFAVRKSALVLAILVMSGPKGIRRERLCGLLWADRGEPQARASLRQALVELRRLIVTDGTPDLKVTGDSDVIALTATSDDADVWHFDELLKAKDLPALAEAADLYAGELLAGVEVPEEVDDWIGPFRQEFAKKALRLAEYLGTQAEVQSSAIIACERLAERLLLADPAAEEAHRALIRIYQRQGKTSAAARQLRQCAEALKQTLGVEPERETMALLETPLPGAALAPDVKSAQPIPNKPSVVVMPFENLSGTDDDFLIDGFVEEITATLSRIRDFFVIARQSAFASKEIFADVRQLGKELGVRYVVQGAGRRSGTNVRITVRLVEAESRTLLWTERYEGSTADVFSLQDKIAEQVAGAIHPAVFQAEIEAVRRKPPDSLRAYELFLQANAKMWKRVESENREAIAFLNQAIAVDKHYGRAYALLAWCHSQNVVYLWSADAEAERRLIRKAIDIAAPIIGDDPLAMTALGAAMSQSLGEHDRARAYVDAALALDPNSAWAWARFGWIILQLEEFEAAKQCFEKALRLSPLDPLAFNFKFGVASCLGHMNQYRQASEMLREILNRYPEVMWGHRMLAAFAALAGEMETARASVQAMLKAQPRVSIAMMRSHHPARNTPRIFDLLVEGWRLAGLPEE
jgi:TolB-like protein/Tfp pilus assembly protein PilF